MSIALQALTGYNTKNFNKLPGKLFTIASERIYKFGINGKLIVGYPTAKGTSVAVIENSNIHVISKAQLFDDNLLEQLDEVIDAPA